MMIRPTSSATMVAMTLSTVAETFALTKSVVMISLTLLDSMEHLLNDGDALAHPENSQSPK
jgi:hypothetical protein